MKIQIYLTNIHRWALDIGNTRLNEYDTLKELFIDLENTLKMSYKDEWTFDKKKSESEVKR